MVGALPKIIPNRKIEAISAVLLPYFENGAPDYESFLVHLERTYAAGLAPAVNMDTGYANLLSPAERLHVLDLASNAAQGRGFVAGAWAVGVPEPASADEVVGAYLRAVEAVQARGGTPVLFQCQALVSLPDDALVEVYARVAQGCDRLLGFELGAMFAPFGKIYSLETFTELMKIPALVGLKHSSLQRELEWERLALRDRLRPDFKIYTGNDLAIDMVMYGSDYLLGLSTFAPDLFARRDAYWAAGDRRFYALNDVLQYLGQFAFRAPVAAYKHSAAQFLELRGWLPGSAPHPQGLRRPDSDREVLAKILSQLEGLAE